MRTVPQSPTNPLTCLGVLGIGHLSILETLSSSGDLPSGVHLCPTITTVGRQICDFLAANVAPAHLILGITRCTSWACSQMNLLMPGFSSNTSGFALSLR